MAKTIDFVNKSLIFVNKYTKKQLLINIINSQITMLNFRNKLFFLENYDKKGHLSQFPGSCFPISS